MKKHKLLEKAMRDYPAGTKFKSALDGCEAVSSGVFSVSELHPNSINCRTESGGSKYVYHHLNDRWAEIIRPSILDGKVAIQVDNEREFKVLMEHYESKGFVQNDRFVHEGFGSTHNIFEYKNEYQRIDESNIIATVQYKVIPFADFAAEVYIKVPMFVMTSEDGVPLYVGDPYYLCAHNDKKGWYFHDGERHPVPMIGYATITMSSFKSPDKYKAFSTREAAEKWIKEQNKPRKIVLDMRDGHVIVYQNEIVFQHNEVDQAISISGGDITKVIDTYQSLQGKELQNG